MQEGGKIAVAVSVTFMSGVVVGWLLNTYTRKVGKGCSRPATHTASALVPTHTCPNTAVQNHSVRHYA